MQYKKISHFHWNVHYFAHYISIWIIKETSLEKNVDRMAYAMTVDVESLLI